MNERQTKVVATYHLPGNQQTAGDMDTWDERTYEVTTDAAGIVEILAAMDMVQGQGEDDDE